MDYEKIVMRITPAYCEEFHRIAWDKACQINNTNPLAVADGIKDVVEALVIARGLLVALDTKATNEVADICKRALAGIKKEA